MHIDAFDSTAALARVEHCSVNQRINSRIKVGISPNIARIFATQFRSNWDKSPSSSLLPEPSGIRALQAKVDAAPTVPSNADMAASVVDMWDGLERRSLAPAAAQGGSEAEREAAALRVLLLEERALRRGEEPTGGLGA